MMKFFGLFSDKKEAVAVTKTTQVVTDKPKSIWRNNMWVMTPDGVGIMFAIAEPALVHLVSGDTGETVASKLYSTASLRQAKYAEIPACRQCSPEKAARLGYL
jgi:hypothetical protein